MWHSFEKTCCGPPFPVMLRWFSLVLLLAGLGPEPASAQSFSCFPPKTCGQLRNCAEAYYRLIQCGDSRRDGDGDGIPCESLCGKTLDVMQRRLAAQGYQEGLGIIANPPSGEFSCSQRKTCKQMLSCKEAFYQLNSCHNTALDGNRDGIPCNSLCRNR